MFTNPFRSAARALTFVWAGFWTFFVIASTLGDGGTGGIGTKLFVCIAGTVFFFGTCALAWKFEHAGGVLLGTEGVILSVLNFTYLHNPPTTKLFLLLTLCLPPLAAAILQLMQLKPNTPRPTTWGAR